MAWSSAWSGTSSQTVGGGEQTIGNSGAALTVAGTYILMIDPTLRAAGDVLEVRAWTKAGSTERAELVCTLWGAQGVAFKDFPRATEAYLRYGITQTAGTARALPYRIVLQ